MLSNASGICRSHMRFAMHRAYARTYGRTNEESYYLTRDIQFRNAREKKATSSPRMGTTRPASATRQAVIHA